MEKVYKTSKVKFITDIAIGAEAGRRSFGTSDFETEIPTLSSTFSQIFTKKKLQLIRIYIYQEKLTTFSLYFYLIIKSKDGKNVWT